MTRRNLACLVWWIGSLPLRIGIIFFISIIAIPALPFFIFFDLKKYGCDGENKKHWDDWSFIIIYKSFYWDFLILGKTDTLDDY